MPPPGRVPTLRLSRGGCWPWKGGLGAPPGPPASPDTGTARYGFAFLPGGRSGPGRRGRPRRASRGLGPGLGCRRRCRLGRLFAPRRAGRSLAGRLNAGSGLASRLFGPLLRKEWHRRLDIAGQVQRPFHKSPVGWSLWHIID
ncbi:hypothetical protein [Desulforudis sp. Tu-874]|uniref:hypothetical protein n=1 Tax=Desulforudis sp. Tu-874 TaxID=3416276 RepID=UPI003CE491A8